MIGRMRLNSNFFQFYQGQHLHISYCFKSNVLCSFLSFQAKDMALMSSKNSSEEPNEKKNPAGQTREFDIALTAGDKKQTVLLGATM